MLLDTLIVYAWALGISTDAEAIADGNLSHPVSLRTLWKMDVVHPAGVAMASTVTPIERLNATYDEMRGVCSSLMRCECNESNS